MVKIIERDVTCPVCEMSSSTNDVRFIAYIDGVLHENAQMVEPEKVDGKYGYYTGGALYQCEQCKRVFFSYGKIEYGRPQYVGGGLTL